MRKQRYELKILLLVLVLICFGQNRYNWAAGERNKLYMEFEQLMGCEQSKAVELGDNLFEDIVARIGEDAGLSGLQSRLKASEEFVEFLTRGLEAKRKNIFADAIDIDILPGIEVGVRERGKSCFELPAASHLYWTNLRNFSEKLVFEGLESSELEFIQQYYALKMQRWIEKSAKAVIGITVTDSESQWLLCYSLVLPLLYTSGNEELWEDMDYLFTIIGMENLDVLSEFCLLQVERIETAISIAKHKAMSECKEISIVEWSYAGSVKCVENYRPDLAERLLSKAVENISDEERIVEVRLKIAENFSNCGDSVTAATECKQVISDYPGSRFWGKAASSYFAYLSKQLKTEEILAEIDLFLENPKCKKYLSQLMYLKWWALRKTNRYVDAKEIGEKLIRDYGHDRCVAPVLLVQAIDALSNQRYERCRELLIQLTTRFPLTDSAAQAQKILSSMK